MTEREEVELEKFTFLSLLALSVFLFSAWFSIRKVQNDVAMVKNLERIAVAAESGSRIKDFVLLSDDGQSTTPRCLLEDGVTIGWCTALPDDAGRCQCVNTTILK